MGPLWQAGFNVTVMRPGTGNSICRLKSKTGLMIAATLIMVLAGCASKPPEAISKIPAENPALAKVLTNVNQYMGTEIRWGGEISKVENRADKTWIEVVRRELWGDGKPKVDGASDGRFIADIAGFADPVVYEVGRLFTVVGVIIDKVERPIGDFDYLFPVVKVEGSYLWEKPETVLYPNYRPPYWRYDIRYYHGGPYYRYPRYTW